MFVTQPAINNSHRPIETNSKVKFLVQPVVTFVYKSDVLNVSEVNSSHHKSTH